MNTIFLPLQFRSFLSRTCAALVVGVVAGGVVTSPVLAGPGGDSHAGHANHSSSATVTTPATAPWVNGEVKKIDVPGGKVTLNHGPLAHLNMPAMTMAFAVSEAAVLAKLKAGDKVRFKAVEIKGVLTVQQIEVLR